MATKLLDQIKGPDDVKKIPLEELPKLAKEIREELIEVLSKTGGHLGPNLGVVELTIALHRVFDTPTDHFIFDVSHQAYVHKLLTGRRDRFHTIRQQGGLNGFMLRTESEHDCFGAGHAGTALSAALGMASARDMRGGKEHVVCLAGDAAFTCGVTFEALNNVSHHTKRLITILNDNKWSIDKNVGAIAGYLNKITTDSRFIHLHERAAHFIEKIGGSKALKVARRAEEHVKGMIFPSVIFEELGVTYYGPVDGHDIPNLIKMFEFLKTQNFPVILHVVTTKGKGYEPALAKQKKFHGLGPYDPETGETKALGQPTYSEVFADHLSKMADNDPRIVAITGAMPNGTGLDRFQPKHLDRYFDVGIAEEHAVLFAAGMATKGFKPFCAIYSTFLQRAYDQIVHDVCLQNLPVVFCMDRGGLSGDDGPTHHGLFDISYLRGVPNLIHMSPKDEDEFVDMLYTASLHAGPVAIRYPRGVGPNAAIKKTPMALPIGKAEVIRHGQKVVIWSYGQMLPMAMQLSDDLKKEEGIEAAVINARFAKPIDTALLQLFGQSADVIVTFEDHVIKGGFGSGILEEVSNLGMTTPVVRIGWPDEFVDHGKPDDLRVRYGLSVKAAKEKLLPHLAKIKGTARKSQPVAA